jgi:(1->4)-alpha-D-glucan 1-alpha-D-glucosylmutase
MLDDLRRRWSEDRIELIRELADDRQRDEIKMFVTWRGLEFRRSHPDLFARGEYIPLSARGAFARHVCAFARRLGKKWAVALAPRWTSQLTDWGDTEIDWPGKAPADVSDCLTGLTPSSWRIADLLAHFPVALLGC